MSRKIKIHCHDDNPEAHKWIKTAFCHDLSDTLYENERIEWVNNNVEFKTFRAVGEAINYYEKTKDYPDILSVDIDCTELSENYLTAEMEKIPKKYKGDENSSKRGKDLLRYAHDQFSDRVIFFFTGQTGESDIFNEVISPSFRLGIETIKKEDGSVGATLQKKIPVFYEKVAKKYLIDLKKNPQSYKKVKNLIDASSDEDILEACIPIEGEEWQLKYLLLCCWNPGKQQFDNVKNTLKKLLDNSFRIRFTQFIKAFDEKRVNETGTIWRHIKRIYEKDYKRNTSFWSDFEKNFFKPFQNLKELNPWFEEFWTEFEKNIDLKNIDRLDSQVRELTNSTITSFFIDNTRFNVLTNKKWYMWKSDYKNITSAIDANADIHGWNKDAECRILENQHNEIVIQCQTDTNQVSEGEFDSFIDSINQGSRNDKVSQLASIVCDLYDGRVEFLSLLEGIGDKLEVKSLKNVEHTENYKDNKDITGTFYRIIFPKDI